MERGMLRGIAVFRWGTWLWMAVVLTLHRADLTRPWLAWLLVGAALAWTATATVLLQRNPSALESPLAIGIELAIGATLGLAGGVVYNIAPNADIAFSSVRTLGFAWPIAGIISAGVVFGPRFGAIAGVVVALPRIFAPTLNGISFGDYRNGKWFSLLSTLILYALAGGVGGYITRALRRAENEVAAARAREQVARTLHDGVLQTLAVIERRADDPQLAQLAHEQERELREFLFGNNGDTPDLGARLRHAAARFEDAFGARAQIVLAPDLPTLSDERVDALAGAVGEALMNAGKHGHATHVTVYAEPSDAADAVLCSVHDDGQGFEVERVQERVGLSRSIRGRVEEVGGRVEVESRPGAGTEVRLWLPCG